MIMHWLRNGCAALFLLLPVLVFAEDRIRVFDDDVLLAIQSVRQSLPELPIEVASLQENGISDCRAYAAAGLPPVDGMLPSDLRICQIELLIQAALPSASQEDPCDALAALGDGMFIGGFNTAMNQRWSLPEGERKRLIELTAIEVLPGCTGLSVVIEDWTVQFVLRAIADWNRDARPDYLLEFIESAHAGTYRASQLLVAVSVNEQQWVATTPGELMRTARTESKLPGHRSSDLRQGND